MRRDPAGHAATVEEPPSGSGECAAAVTHRDALRQTGAPPSAVLAVDNYAVLAAGNWCQLPALIPARLRPRPLPAARALVPPQRRAAPRTGTASKDDRLPVGTAVLLFHAQRKEWEPGFISSYSGGAGGEDETKSWQRARHWDSNNNGRLFVSVVCKDSENLTMEWDERAACSLPQCLWKTLLRARGSEQPAPAMKSDQQQLRYSEITARRVPPSPFPQSHHLTNSSCSSVIESSCLLSILTDTARRCMRRVC